MKSHLKRLKQKHKVKKYEIYFKKNYKKSTPYFIAEIGEIKRSLKEAKKLINYAKSAGAEAVKFQTYKAGKLAAKKSPYYWDIKKESTKSQYELFSKFDKFNFEDYKTLSLYCKKKNIEFLSTPFDLDAVDFLNPLVKIFKISSSDITNLPLLKAVASKKLQFYQLVHRLLVKLELL